MAQFASAAIFVDDTGGNAQPSAADNGETTIIADGGTSATPVVTIGSDINLNGQNDQLGVLVISNVPYTVNVASGGVLVANSGQNGINSSSVITLVNNGTITGGALPSEGIETVGGLTSITNNGRIIGSDDAIFFTSDGGTVINSVTGTIDGITGASSDGIQGDDHVFIQNSGSFIGADDGIDIDDFGTVNNLTGFSLGIPTSGGSITGVNAGIAASDALTVNNQLLSTITGTAATGLGIDANDFADITNSAGATITGGLTGINVEDDLLLVNNGTITGTAGDGVNSDDDADITNGVGATITGGLSGIVTDDRLLLANNGNITGLNGDGVNAGESADITNNSTIIGTGALGDGLELQGGAVVENIGTITSISNIGINVNSNLGETFQLTNSGLIQGFVASVVGDASDDTLNLNLGSRLIGGVFGNAGTDTINFDAGLTTPLGTGNSISGDVLGFNAINKASGGTAFIGLPGDPLFNVTADAINITGGGLYINADIAGDTVAQSTINAAGAALGGLGTWNANVNITNGGFSAGATPINLNANPVNGVGTLTVAGNVTHTANTFIRYDVKPFAAAQTGLPGTGVTAFGDSILVSGGTTADLINHTGPGSYNMGGGFVRISSTNNDLAVSDGTYVIVQSTSPILGTVQGTPNVQFNANVNDFGPFTGNQTGANNSNTVFGNFFSQVGIIGNQILLTVVHDFGNLPGLSSNAAAFGNALDASNSSPNALTQDFIAALDNSNLGTVQATLNGLSPDATFGTAIALASSNNRLNGLVRDHLALTRAGGDTVRSYVGSYSAPAPAPQVQNSGMGNVWGAVSYAWRDIENDNVGNNFDGEEASFTAGVDYRVSQDFLIGLVLDGSNADYDYNGGGSDVDSLRAAIYGTYGASTGLYADFLVGYGKHDIDLDRNAGILGNINSDTEADSFQAAITVGYAMQSGSVKHGPFGGFEYQNIDVDGYTQGGIFPVAVEGYDVDSFRLLAGYRVEADYGRFMPYFSVAYAHEFEDDALNTTAVIPGGAGFRVGGSGLESSVLISAGANFALTDSLTLTGGYHGEIAVGGDGADSHGASLGLNYAF